MVEWGIRRCCSDDDDEEHSVRESVSAKNNRDGELKLAPSGGEGKRRRRGMKKVPPS